MSFTQTVLSEGPGPSRRNPGEMAETGKYVNTAGSTGGTLTARFLKTVDRIEGSGIIQRVISGKTVVITTVADADGDYTLYGRS